VATAQAKNFSSMRVVTRLLRAVVLVTGLTVLLSPGDLAAQETVLARAFQGPTFSRIVFDWPAPVPYQARAGGDLLVIEFDRPLTADLSPITDALGEIILDARVEGDGRSVTLLMSAAFQIKTTVNGASVIFDIVTPRSAARAAPVPTAPPPAASRRQAAPTKPQPAPSAAPANGPSIRVRAGVHDTYTRVVFDWPSDVVYEVSKTGGTVSVQFNRPANFGISRRLASGELSRIGSVTGGAGDGGAVVSIAVDDASRVRHFRNGRSVVVDILGAAASQQAAAQPSAPAQRERAAPSPPAVPVAPVSARPAPEHDEETTGEDTHTDSVVAEAGAMRVTFTQEEGALFTTFDTAAPVAAAFFERAGFVWAVFDQELPIDIQPVPRGLAETVFLAAAVETSDATALRIRVRQDLFLSGVTRVGGTWRINFGRSPEPPAHPVPVRREAGASGQARVALPLPEAGHRVEISDPEVGDAISVVPSLRSASGVAAERAFAQFRVLATAQGVAVERWSDDVAVTAHRSLVEIAAPEGLFLSEDGLQEVQVADAEPTGDDGHGDDEASDDHGEGADGHAEDESTGAHDEEGESAALAGVDSLLQYHEWRRGDDADYREQLAALNVALSTATESRRSTAQWDLARFYFAHNMAPDALGVLRLLAEENPAIEQDLTYRAVRGASRFLMGRTDEAAEDLLSPAFSADPGVSLWRGALFAERGDWIAAQQEFAIGGFAIPAVPSKQQARFKLLSARAALKSDDLDTVDAELASFEQHPGATPALVSEAKLVLGEARLVGGDPEGGLAILEEVIAERVRPIWAEADIVRNDYLLSEGEIDQEEAINRLQRLEHVWRGGKFELDLLKRLKNMHLESGNFRAALETLRAISNTFEGLPDAREAGDEMEAVYRRLYLDGESEQLGPVAALGLYFDFRELTPVGGDGDQMVRNLADRLVSVDLLGRAAELIDFQVNFRLRGAEKARVAAKLAAIYLLDRQPEKALEALDKSRFRAIPGSLLRERRYLQTRALIELQRFDDAQRLIARDQSTEANALRADVYWSTSDWPSAAGAFEVVLGNRDQNGEELSRQERNQVMQMTVAYALANDREAIDEVRTRYSALMSTTEDASAFEVLTSNPDRASIGFREVASRIAQINTLDSFMDRYRSDLQNDGVGAIN
jgi:hypothetical protein